MTDPSRPSFPSRPPLRRLLDRSWQQGPQALQSPAERALLDELSDDDRCFVEAFAEGVRRRALASPVVSSGLSSRSPERLPDIPTLQRLCRALAALDAILCPEWEDRYYSYDARWAASAECASMRNGQGDFMFLHFSAAGALIKGFDHECMMSPWSHLTAAYHGGRRGQGLWPGLVEQVPRAFEPALREPAFDWAATTFCLWREADSPRWCVGPVDYPAYDYLKDGDRVDVFAPDDLDGSAYLLAIYDGDPRTYKAFADGYFNEGENDYPLDAIATIYRLAPIDAALVHWLNPDRDLSSLADDLVEIGYPGGLVG